MKNIFEFKVLKYVLENTDLDKLMHKIPNICIIITMFIVLLLCSCSEENTNLSVGTNDVKMINEEELASLIGFLENGEQSIILGMSAAFSGPSAGLGGEFYRGAKAYFDYINSNGGIKGYKIKIMAIDDGYQPNRAIHNTELFVNHSNVYMLFDYVGTPTTTRILPLLKINPDNIKYLFGNFTGAEPQRNYPYSDYVYNVRASYRQETEMLVDFFVGEGKQNIGMFYQIDAYGRSGQVGVKIALENHNLKIVAESTYRRGSTYEDSYLEQVNNLKQNNVDAIISIGSYAACAGFIRDCRQNDFNVPIANISFVGSENLLNLLIEEEQKSNKIFTNNLYNSQVVPYYKDTTIEIVNEYKQLMDENDPVLPDHLLSEDYKSLDYSFTSFEGFINAKIFCYILNELQNPLDVNEFKRWVKKSYEFDIGLPFLIQFSKNSNQAINNVFITKVENGQYILLGDN